MADLTRNSSPNDVLKLYRDMGDGTYAEVVALAATPTIDIGDVQVIAGGAIGEVQASPTANTVLDRLKALLTGIALAAGSAIIGKVDINQATPGTTNAVTLVDSSGATLTSQATYTDRSGTITSGGTAQTLMALNASRRGFLLQNNSTGDLWISSVTTAVQSQPSLRLSAGAYYEPPVNGIPTSAISIIGATTGQTFSAREW